MRLINLKIIIIITVVFVIGNFIAYSTTNRFIDTVYSFSPGSGQNTGQSFEYFPMNIFGPPSKNATNSIPETAPNEIVSLGLGGEIIVGFKNSYIVDGDGVDFIIFENAFFNPINKKIFAEPAIVSVSEDGINYIQFPFDTLTLNGCAGTKPTNGKQNPFDINVSGGNGFDLSLIGLKRAKYIKIKDISNIILENDKHPFYDPTISGFDLDAVAGLFVVDETNIINNLVDLNTIYEIIDVYSYSGSKLASYHNLTIDNLKQYLSSGIYFVTIPSRLSTQKYFKLCID